MGRPARIVGAGATYHVVARGNDRGSVFLDDQDRRCFLRLLDDVAADADWRGLAYCLMGNHFHLALSTPLGNLPEGMRDLLGRYSRAFNRAHDRSGHVFGDRYRASVIESDPHLLAVVRYVARNPVVAGLIADAADWEWGSYWALLAGRTSSAFVDSRQVLELFHRQPDRARTLLRSLVTMDTTSWPEEPAPLPAAALRRGPSTWQAFAVMTPEQAIEFCRREGRTQAEIAAAAGVSRSMIGRRFRTRYDARLA